MKKEFGIVCHTLQRHGPQHRSRRNSLFLFYLSCRVEPYNVRHISRTHTEYHLHLHGFCQVHGSPGGSAIFKHHEFRMRRFTSH